MHLIRAERGTFAGPAAFLADERRRADVAAYLADMVRPFGARPGPELSGHSYGEMAAALVAATVPEDEPVDLLVLAFAVHDMWPGRATATYLSHLCPGTPLSFAVCDQGTAAPFTALRLIRDLKPRKGLLIAVEQAMLPYDSAVPPPVEHRGVAVLCGDGAGARVTDLRQYPDVAPDSVPGQASLRIAELTAGHPGARLVLGDALAEAWPDHPDCVRVPAGRPTTGVWWHLAGALRGPAGPVVVADYDRDLRYLCLAAIEVR
ncbi:hypothetical protein [Saccharothrix syringae]|uniref:2-hydroxy-acid oxidase n=1 Tax=Saccharothrix syringae TaxID=103733 RepID=A0A5Q0H511_SACSY|nr:hypothetical protein [Saccharothrix syringae]QFZ21229.1 2-hydroxy-acid oxidase [Saccharothrix syringae]